MTDRITSAFGAFTPAREVVAGHDLSGKTVIVTNQADAALEYTAQITDPTQFDAKSDYYDAKSTKENPRWSCIEVSFHQGFKRLVSLPDLRECAALKEMLILRPGNRLSVTPVTAAEFKAIAGLGGLRK